MVEIKMIKQFYIDRNRRTETFLSNIDALVELTSTQKDKLFKLEQELKQKKISDEINSPMNLKISENTGIPVDLVALDVIKLAKMFGFIKSKAIRNGKEKDTQKSSLIQTLFGTKEPTYEKRIVNFKNIPFYFNHNPTKILEAEKLEIQQQIVKQECDYMHREVLTVLAKVKAVISKRIVFLPLKETVKAYKQEGLLCIKDLWEGVKEDLQDNESVDEMLTNIYIIRNELLGLVDIYEYKKLLLSHVDKMYSFCIYDTFKYLSFIDCVIIVHPGYRTKPMIEFEKLYDELRIRCFVKSPRLKPLNVQDLIYECCNPCLAFLTVETVLQYCLIGPFNNNAIVFFENYDYYILKGITDNVRMWVVDPGLFNTIKTLRQYILDYLCKTFRIFYKDNYGTREFRKNFTDVWILNNIIDNIIFTCSDEFINFNKKFIASKSILVPTELDVFNIQTRVLNKTLPKINSDVIIGSLFEPDINTLVGN